MRLKVGCLLSKCYLYRINGRNITIDIAQNVIAPSISFSPHEFIKIRRQHGAMAASHYDWYEPQ